jgi:inosine-uridine nucleoside N-ribohydrolase
MVIHGSMKKIKFYIVIISFFILNTPIVSLSAEKEVPRIIFDTDMGPDYDDVGAISILHALAAKKECKILATVASNQASSTAPTIEVYNRFFRNPDIPIGVPFQNAPDITPGNHWTDTIVHRYLSLSQTNKDYPSAVSVYRKVLAAQPDHSVTIVTVGFLSNLEALLKSAADSYSSLSGRDLIKKKVKKYVAMAGKFPEGKEFNIYCDSTSSAYVISHWPTPILFSGFEIGEKILTGKKLANSSLTGPAKEAYQYCLRTYAGKPVDNRCSWDLTAVLCAIRNPEKYFYISGEGTFICNPDGSNFWNPDQKSGHFFLIHKYPYQTISDQLEELMIYQPPTK